MRSLTALMIPSLSCFAIEERASKLAEFRERINLLSEELEGLAGSKLLKEESFLVRFLIFHLPLPLESQIFAREQLGRGHWYRPDSRLASDDPRLLSLHECWPSFCSGARLETRPDLQSGDAGR